MKRDPVLTRDVANGGSDRLTDVLIPLRSQSLAAPLPFWQLPTSALRAARSLEPGDPLLKLRDALFERAFVLA